MPTYWLNLFSPDTWQEFLDADSRVTGFRASRLKTIKKIKPGDIFLCYMTGISRWVGALEAISEGYEDERRVWSVDVFPARVDVRPIVTLTPETGVPIFELRNELSIFENLSNPNAWTGRLRGSPSRWKREDGEAIVTALKAAEAHPVRREVDTKNLRRISPFLRGEQVNDHEEVDNGIANETALDRTVTSDAEASEHTLIQWMLLKLGSDMGLDVWVASNDRGKSYNCQAFADLRKLRKRLPRQFDKRTSEAVERIDVLWIKNDAIIAAFEIESTTAIYSGFLRMSDLVARQPHLNIPLFIVGPENRRNKVMREIVRPTFEALQTPLRDLCMFISFEELIDLDQNIRKALPSLSALQPDFIQQIAESATLLEDYDEED